MGVLAPSLGLPQAGDVIGGKYRVERLLGRGGMGAVFAAENMLTGRRVAIKWLLPERARSAEARTRLLREARATTAVRHENVVEVLDVVEHDDALFLVMEYLDGQPLSGVLLGSRPTNVVEVLQTVIPAMRGMHAAHAVGVVHRDIKPDNIMIVRTPSGDTVPKVVDFGVSKLVRSDSNEVSLTKTGAIVGTPHYMALEQVDGSDAIDAQTDVYAFGVLLYFALTGRHPHEGDSVMEIVFKIGTRTPLPLGTHRADLPEGLDAVVMKALAREKSSRYAGLDELAQALQPFASVSSQRLSQPAIEAARTQTKRSSRVRSTSSVVAVLLGVALGWLALRQGRAPHASASTHTGTTTSAQTEENHGRLNSAHLKTPTQPPRTTPRTESAPVGLEPKGAPVDTVVTLDGVRGGVPFQGEFQESEAVPPEGRRKPVRSPGRTPTRPLALNEPAPSELHPAVSTGPAPAAGLTVRPRSPGMLDSVDPYKR